MFCAISLNIKSTIVGNYPGNPYRYLALDFVTHVLLIHSFFPIFDKGLGNGPLWTLAREEQYYLLYFPLLKLKRAAGIWACLLISMISSYCALHLSQSLTDIYPVSAYVLGTSCFSFWPQWVLGMVSMELLVNRRRAMEPFGYRMAALIGMAAIVWQKEVPGPVWIQYLTFGFGFFMIVSSFCKIELDGRWSRSTIVRNFERIGIYSYSLYLVHYPILIILSRFARSSGSNRNVTTYLISMAVCVFVCNLFALVLYRYVERHGQSKPSAS